MARPKLGESETVRLQLVITADEVAAVDRWQHENSVASRSAAVRQLVQLGLRTMDNLDALAKAIYDTSEEVDALDDEVWAFIQTYGSDHNARRVALGMALTFLRKYPKLATRARDAHNLMTDFGIEINAVNAEQSIPLGIEAGNQARQQAVEQRERWAQEDALTSQLKKEVESIRDNDEAEK